MVLGTPFQLCLNCFGSIYLFVSDKEIGAPLITRDVVRVGYLELLIFLFVAILLADVPNH